MSDATLWEQYVDAYHEFWNYLEENEWVLQERNCVILVCHAMEDCPVVNFSCVRDLIYTMRQFLGEKRFKEKESQWRANLNLMVDRCINNDICNLTVEVKHPYSFHQEACDDTMSHKDFYDTFTKLREKQEHLRELPVTEYHYLVYGQSIYRQQALVLNFKILCTFCDNLGKYFKVEPSDCHKVLQRLTWEALNHEALCIQAVDGYMDEFASIITSQTLTRISVWPMYEPVVGSYDERKEFLIKCWEAQGKPKSTMPPIYTPQLTSEGRVCSWWKTLEGSEPTEVPLQSIPHKISASKHFQRVMTIVQSGDYGLYHDQTDPNKESNWVYYIVVFDAIVSPETADQGYIGETTNTLLARTKQHTRQEDMIIRYNLALLSRFLQQRGKELSEYVAVFALGTTKEKTSCKKIEGKLIRESLDGFSVADMKYGMNCKQGSTANNEQNEQDVQNEHPTCFKLTEELKEETETDSEASHGEFSEERHTETMPRECSKIRHGEDSEMRNGGNIEVRLVSEIRQISEIQNGEVSEMMTESETRRGEDTETRRGEDTETRRGEDTDTRRGEDTETRQGEDTEMRQEEDTETRRGEDTETRRGEDTEMRRREDKEMRRRCDVETRRGEDTEMRQREDTETRRGEDKDMRRREYTEMRQGEDTGTRQGGKYGVESGMRCGDSATRCGQESEMRFREDLEMGNGEDSVIKDAEIIHIPSTRKIQYGNSETRYGEDTEMMQNSEMRDGEDAVLRNGKDSEMETPEDSGSENGEDSEMENPEDSGSEKGEDSEMGNPEDSEMENREDSVMENGEDSDMENREDSVMENGEDSETENREDSVMENSRVTKGEYSERTHREDSEMGKASKMGEDSQRKHSPRDLDIHNVELKQECSEKLKYIPKSLMKSDAEEHKMKELLMEELERQIHMIQKRNEHRRSMYVYSKR